MPNPALHTQQNVLLCERGRAGLPTLGIWLERDFDTMGLIMHMGMCTCTKSHAYICTQFNTRVSKSMQITRVPEAGAGAWLKDLRLCTLEKFAFRAFWQKAAVCVRCATKGQR